MTTINGRTLEEIKRGLECCKPKWEHDRWISCSDDCPFMNEGTFCRIKMQVCVYALIQQLERERDAAVEQLRRADKENLFECTHCKHNVSCSEILLGCDVCDNSECPCSTCVDLSNWQWRGVQEVEE